MIACSKNYKELAVALLELGADIEARNDVSKVWPGHCMTPGVSRLIVFYQCSLRPFVCAVYS